MSKTSTASKDKYNAKAYDQITIRVKSGHKEKIKLYCDYLGVSVNGYIVGLINKNMGE